MCLSEFPAVQAGLYHYSKVFRRGVSALSGTAFARLDVKGGICITSEQHRASLSRSSVPQLPAPGEGAQDAIVGVEPVPVSKFHSWCPELAEADADWAGFEILLQSGAVDALALRLEGGAHDSYCDGVAAAIWPILREDCLAELSGRREAAAADALLWMISKRIGAGVLVLDERGRVIRANATGAEILREARLLREGPEGLRCRTSAETRGLRHALNECFSQGPETEMILFIESESGAGRLPLSLSRYPGEDLVVAVLPREPDQKRVEMIAQKMGLTPVEARVAALMQLGIPNRQAAYIAGVKEQTFNTYSKRVLAKLNMSSRAEMAHMLTWQAGMGRA
jgi:DNA-binding CsgD family transcriptional regulator